MDFAEDIIYYDHSPNSYAFLMEKQTGKLLYHPIFSHHTRYSHKHPNKHNSVHDSYLQTSFTNAEHVEQSKEFPQVKELIMKKSAGSHTIRLSYPTAAINETFNFFHDGRFANNRPSIVTYYWRQVASSSYVLVIAEYGTDNCLSHNAKCGFRQSNSLNLTLNENGPSFVSHRLDYMYSLDRSNSKLCKHFNQLATIGITLVNQ